MASHGADQLIVQRLLSARSLKASQAAVIGSGVAVIFQFALFLMLGVGLWGFYGAKTFASPDSIFPTFIVDHMPHGLIGLLLAAMLAATMSTHSGAINSLAAAATHDIYLPLTGKRPTIRRRFASAGGSRSSGASCSRGAPCSSRRTPRRRSSSSRCRSRRSRTGACSAASFSLFSGDALVSRTRSSACPLASRA